VSTQLRARLDSDSAMSATAWLDKHGGEYSTEEERRAAYRDFKANLAALHAIFGRGMT
jgi:hypothetical protein